MTTTQPPTMAPGERFEELPERVRHKIVDAFLDKSGHDMVAEIRGVSHVDAVSTIWRWNRLILRHCDEAAKASEESQ